MTFLNTIHNTYLFLYRYVMVLINFIKVVAQSELLINTIVQALLLWFFSENRQKSVCKSAFDVLS